MIKPTMEKDSKVHASNHAKLIWPNDPEYTAKKRVKKKNIRIHSEVIQTEIKRWHITMLNKTKPFVACQSSST